MNKNIAIETIQKPYDTSSIKVKAPFACLLYSDQENVSDDEMVLIANWLVLSGCRYALCAGFKCERWHDTIDTADIIRDPTIQNLVMTTWHKNEPIEEVVWSWLNSTNFKNIIFENYLALLIDDSKTIEEKIRQAVKNNSL